MPIYAYQCSSCGYAKDVLQKMSDAPLSDCPHCGAATFQKQVTAAGFQLKGGGWYATDFKGAPSGSSASSASAGAGSDAQANSSSTDASSGGACGSACACH